MVDLTAPRKQISIWWFAFGYFAAYVPYSYMTKVLTEGLLVSPFPEMTKDSVTVNSFEILPPTIFASIVVMIIFISILGWWKYATQWTLRLGDKKISLPRPRILTLLSGICSGLVVVTTTLAYTIEGVSIVFAMLLMRGGLLIMSPIVDTLNRRYVRWFSWCALGLSLASLFVAFLAKPPSSDSTLFNVMLMIDVGIYLAAYFVRLSLMSKLAKSENADDTKKFFVEEMLIGTPSIFIILFVVSLFYSGQDASTFIGGIYAGFHNFLNYPALVIGLAMAIGFCSQFNGVFGGLILLDKSENAFAVPVNRCSSILAGTVATLGLAFFFASYRMPATSEFVGASFILCAILFLTIPPQITKRRAKRLAQRSEG